MQTDMQTGTPVALADGRRLIVSNEQVSITDRTGTVITTINRNDISAISRGGREIIVTRSRTDPVVLSAASIQDAQQIMMTPHLHALPPSAPRWWRRRRVG